MTSRARMTLSEMKQWVNKSIESTGFQVKDLNKSWQNGQAFAALLYSFRPELIDYPSLSFIPEKALENNQLVFDAAKKAGIDPLLDAPDIVTYQDEKSIFTYLTGFYSAFCSQTPRFYSPAPSPRNPASRTFTEPAKSTPVPSTKSNPSSKVSDTNSTPTPSPSAGLSSSTERGRALPPAPTTPLNNKLTEQENKIKQLTEELQATNQKLLKQEEDKSKHTQIQKEIESLKKQKDEFESYKKGELEKLKKDRDAFETTKKVENDKLRKEREHFVKDKEETEKCLRLERETLLLEKTNLQNLKEEMNIQQKLSSTTDPKSELDTAINQMFLKHAEINQKVADLRSLLTENQKAIAAQKVQNQLIMKKFGSIVESNLRNLVKDAVARKYEEKEEKRKEGVEGLSKENSLILSKLTQFHDSVDSALDRIDSFGSEITKLNNEITRTENEWQEREQISKEELTQLIQNKLGDFETHLKEEKEFIDKYLLQQQKKLEDLALQKRNELNLKEKDHIPQLNDNQTEIEQTQQLELKRQKEVEEQKRLQQQQQQQQEQQQQQKQKEIELQKQKELELQKQRELEQQQKQKELELQKQRELEHQQLQKQKELDLQKQRELEQQKQKELEQQKQKELEQKQKELEQQKQRELEQQKQKELEQQKQKELEQQKQKELELQKQKELEQQKQKEFELQKQKELELQKQKEKELELQKQKEKELELQKQKEKELELQKQKEKELEVQKQKEKELELKQNEEEKLLESEKNILSIFETKKLTTSSSSVKQQLQPDFVPKPKTSIFDDDDEEDDGFNAMITSITSKLPAAQPIVKKQTSLFDDDEDIDDFFNK